jgi:hypothetical protein
MRVSPLFLLIGAAIGCSSASPHSASVASEARRGSPAPDAVRAERFPLGCYRADRILGHAARAEAGLVSHGFDKFRLLPDGRVARPQLSTARERAMWARAGAWQLHADTLTVRLSTGLVGWALRLEVQHTDSRDTALVGMARYLTDVVVRDTTGWYVDPLRFPVRVTAEACSPPT